MAETETEAAETTGEAALAETENAEQKFWDATGNYFSAAEAYWGDEEKGITGKLELFKQEIDEGHVPAKDSDKAIEHVEPIRASGKEAVDAYNNAVTCFEAVKEAYENCDETTKANNADIERVYTEAQNHFEDLKGESVSQAIVDFHMAWCNGYGDIRAYIIAASEYLGEHREGMMGQRDGLLDNYKNAVAKNEYEEVVSKEEILELYQIALEGRILAMDTYGPFREKYDAIQAAYEAFSEEDLVSSFGDVEGSFMRIYSNYESGEELYQNIPEVPVLSFGNAPKMSLNENADTVLEKFELTDEEKALREAGSAPIVTMTVDDAEPDNTEQNLIEQTRGGFFVGMNLNIEVSLRLGNISRNVTDMSNPVDMTINMPDELLNKDTTRNRIYAVIRIHNGEASVIEGTFDPVSGKFTFASDGFSTYSIIYKDEPLLGGNEGESKEENNEEDSDDQEALPAGAGNGSNGQVSPKTGDNTPIGFLLTLFIASAAGMVFFWKKKICIED